MKDKHVTVVQFKKFHDGDIIALFLYEKWDLNGCITSYMHIGQHSGASKKLCNDLDNAKPNEYMELKKELEIIGYNFEGVQHEN
tara:strand:- start:217 stop:468 length:252 start_codon:yes stop_codon:yes gene_type:complete